MFVTFTTIRKHQTWLWGFIIAAVIVSFVIYFTPGVRLSRGGGIRSDFGTMNGRGISRREYLEAYRDVQLAFFIRYGTWPDTEEQRKFSFVPERETRSRLVLVDKVRELKIRVSDEAVGRWLGERFADPKSPGSEQANYEAFVRRGLGPHGVTSAEFEGFVRNEIAIAHLVGVAGLPGKLITPREGAALYSFEHEKIEAEAAPFSVSNYLAAVKLEPAALAEYYTNHQSEYRIPERVQVSYVRFDLTNYFARADEILGKNTNLNAEIERAYLTSGPNYFTDAEGHVLTADAAKARIKQQARDRQAMALARKAATDFANELAKVQPVKAENLGNFAVTKGLAVIVTEPFKEFDTPSGLKVRASFSETAFKLTPAKPISSPLPGEDGFYLISLNRRSPSEQPPLDNVRAKVTEDFRQFQARQLVRQAGTNFVHLLTNALAQGKAFLEVCQEAKVPTITVPAFAANARSLPELDRRLDLSQVRGAAAGLPAGKTTDFLESRDGGFVLHVKARIPVADAELKKELPKYLEDLRQSQHFDAFNEWFRKQMELSRIDTFRGRGEETAEE